MPGGTPTIQYIKVFNILLLFTLVHSCTLNNSATNNTPDKAGDGIQIATLADAGLNQTLIDAMQDSIAAGNYPNIHSVLLYRNNRLVFENYWDGQDENRRTNFKGLTIHHRDSLHDIRSITKSITSAAVMLALDQGKIKNLDQLAFDFFPEFAHYATGGKRDITIRHLLTMSSGLQWQEINNDSLKKQSISYALDYILRQPLAHQPGTKFHYNSASTQLLAQIVERATGMNIEAFTVQYLFNPLGIKSFEWTKEKNGLISAWAGLRMRSRDILKIGMLYLMGGKWDGKQIITSHLIDESMQTHIYTEVPYGYGYQFWTLVDTVENKPVHTIEASGNGGQKIEINRSQNLVMVITAGNYDSILPGKTSYDLYLDFVCPAIMK